jgi:hypothetical protein
MCKYRKIVFLSPEFKNLPFLGICCKNQDRISGDTKKRKEEKLSLLKLVIIKRILTKNIPFLSIVNIFRIK